MNLRYTRKIGDFNFLFYVKGLTSGMLKYIEEKISEYKRTISYHKQTIENLEGLLKYSEMLTDTSEQEANIHPWGGNDPFYRRTDLLDFFVEEFENDPEDHDAVLLCDDLAEVARMEIIRAKTETFDQAQDQEAEKDNIRIWKWKLKHAKMRIYITKLHKEENEREHEKIRSGEHIKEILNEIEKQLLLEKIKPKHGEEEKYYKKGEEDGYRNSLNKHIRNKNAKYKLWLEERKKLFAKTHLKWTAEEDARLMEQFKDGESLDDLVKSFQRSPRAIKERLIKHGLLIKIF